MPRGYQKKAYSKEKRFCVLRTTLGLAFRVPSAGQARRVSINDYGSLTPLDRSVMLPDYTPFELVNFYLLGKLVGCE